MSSKLMGPVLIVAAFTLFSPAKAMVQCPAFGSTGPIVEVDGASLNRGIRTEVIVGTDINARDCDALLRVGYMTIAPILKMRQTNASARGLEVVAKSDCDPTLLVELASGHLAFEDDTRAIGRVLDPVIPLPALGDDTYTGWLGSYRDS